MSPITYPQLRTAMQQELGQHSPSNQVLSNLGSALNQYLADLAIPPEANVGVEFRTSYHKLTARHLASMREAGRSEQSIRDRKSRLKRWRTLFLQFASAQAAENHTPTPFANALNEALPTGLSLKLLADQSGVSVASLRRWRQGVLPTNRSLPSLRRLERFLALPEGQLVDFIDKKIGGSTETTTSAKTFAYREHVKDLSKTPYRLKDASEPLRVSWRAFLEYKSSVLTFDFKRNGRGRWNPSPLHPGLDQVAKKWFAFNDLGEHVPSANLNWGYTSSFFGWLTKYSGRTTSVDTIAWLADPAALTGYIKWLLKRSHQQPNTGHVTFVAFILSLMHPETGYLTQNKDLRLSLPNPASEEQWSQMCSQSFTQLKGYKRQLQREAKKSRDPRDAVEHIISLPDPLLALQDMRNRLRANRPTAGTFQEAIWGRDLALISLMLCSPLRAKNLKHLKYHSSKELHLRKKSNGTWELYVPKEEFKNVDGAAKDRDYRIELDSAIYRDLEAYLTHFRPMLLNGNTSVTDLLFVTQERGPKNLPWHSLNRRIEALTKRYLMRCPGVGPHTIRHLIATAIIKKTGEFNTAALVLHDREETVRKHYAHLLTEDGNTRYRSLFPSLFTG